MEVSFWVQIVPERADWHDNIYGAKTVKFSKRKPKPEALIPDARLVKVVLDVPADNFTTQAVEMTVTPPTPIRVAS